MKDEALLKDDNRPWGQVTQSPCTQLRVKLMKNPASSRLQAQSQVHLLQLWGQGLPRVSVNSTVAFGLSPTHPENSGNMWSRLKKLHPKETVRLRNAPPRGQKGDQRSVWVEPKLQGTLWLHGSVLWKELIHLFSLRRKGLKSSPS